MLVVSVLEADTIRAGNGRFQPVGFVLDSNANSAPTMVGAHCLMIYRGVSSR